MLGKSPFISGCIHVKYEACTHRSYPDIAKFVSVQELFWLSTLICTVLWDGCDWLRIRTHNGDYMFLSRGLHHHESGFNHGDDLITREQLTSQEILVAYHNFLDEVSPFLESTEMK